MNWAEAQNFMVQGALAYRHKWGDGQTCFVGRIGPKTTSGDAQRAFCGAFLDDGATMIEEHLMPGVERMVIVVVDEANGSFRWEEGWAPLPVDAAATDWDVMLGRGHSLE